MRLPFWALLLGGLLSCGSRTGLFTSVANDAGNALPDGVAPDVDASVADAGADAFDEDASEEDALPPIDVSPPMPINDCPDAGSTLVYLIAEDGMLMSFYPPTGGFTTIERILCPALPLENPFSMAVDRTGVAYILFSNTDHTFGELFRISTKPGSPCQPTRFQSGEQGFAASFGMGFSSDKLDAGETLFVAGDSPSSSVLASLDTKSYALGIVGAFNPPIGQPELTGTGAGDLFAFYGVPVGTLTPPGSAIGQIDKATGRIAAQSNLPGVAQGNAWAFAFWGGDFYTFTQPDVAGTSSVVTRFRPSDGTIVRVGRSDHVIVGAGVSTCAPQQ